jgi:hypothetical protein
MNTKIFALIKKNLDTAFALPKYETVRAGIGADTIVEDLPWTPARYRKFKDAVEAELGLPCDYRGTLAEIVNDLSERYTHRFFAEIWKPRTGDYDHSGWALAEEIAKQRKEEARIEAERIRTTNEKRIAENTKIINDYIVLFNSNAGYNPDRDEIRGSLGEIVDLDILEQFLTTYGPSNV